MKLDALSVNCRTCKYNNGFIEVRIDEEPCWTCLHSGDEFPAWEPEKAEALKKTNGDAIRAMSDEELAREIVRCRDADIFRKTVLGMRMNTEEEWLEWLKAR